MEELTFDDIEGLNDKTSPVKKRIKNSDLNDDEPSIALNNKIIQPSQIEQIEIDVPSNKSSPERPKTPPMIEKNASPVKDSDKKTGNVFKEDDVFENPEPVFKEKDNFQRKTASVLKEKEKTPVKKQSVKNYEPDEEDMTEEEQIQEYRYKFRMLKRNYSYIEPPQENATLTEMKRAYDRAMKEVSSDTNVQNYHMYLICGFFAVEYISKNVIGLDLSGFTVDRIKRINRYNRLLIELGERSYASVGSSWPVEVRLCIFVIVDAVIFYIVSKVVGGNSQLMDVIMNTISGAPSKSEDGNGGGLGNIMNLFGQVMTGMGNMNSNPAPQQPKEQVPQQQPATKPYEMKPPRFMKKQ